MYLDFFQLHKNPFHITPDPDLLFLGSGNREAYAAVVYGVTERKGFVAITGEVGVGKTTVIRSFLEREQRPDLKVIYIFNADTSFSALLRTIYDNLGVQPGSDNVYDMVNGLHGLLVDLYTDGINVILIIDEAQNMPTETLHSLHMLSNLETSTEKLIQIVFSGQPEFEQKLDQHALRQLKQRIAIQARIRPLTEKETVAYIRHRIGRTAKGPRELFTPGALSVIVRHARGIPRVVNVLCDNCLITAFGRGEKKVTPALARSIVADWSGRRPVLGRRPALALTAGFLLLVLLFVAGRFIPGEAPAVSARVSSEKVPLRAPLGGEVPKAEAAGRGKASSRRREETTRVVRHGDTLAGLIQQTYGKVNDQLLDLVQERNPWIRDENLIVEGDQITFPVKR